jgi:hypothetical protein
MEGQRPTYSQARANNRLHLRQMTADECIPVVRGHGRERQGLANNCRLGEER